MPLPPEFRVPPLHDYQVKNEEIQQKLREVGKYIGDTMPEGWGFTLLMFNYGGDTGTPGEGMFYLSSADRGDMILAMKEFIHKQEQ